jgi:hypothetical protein
MAVRTASDDERPSTEIEFIAAAQAIATGSLKSLIEFSLPRFSEGFERGRF